MKRHATTAAEILAMMTKGEHLPSRVDRAGNDLPTPDAERLATHADVVDIAQHPERIRCVCVGCKKDKGLLECAVCSCGGMVCIECQAAEEEGECEHEMGTLEEALDEAAEAAAGRTEHDSIEAQWTSFRAQVLTPTHFSAGAEHIMHSTFFSGALCMLSAVTEAFRLPSPALTAVRMRELQAEISAWYDAQQTKQ